MKALEKEYSDLEEIWKAEKATVQGAAHIKEELERARQDLDTARRAQDLARMSELQYGKHSRRSSSNWQRRWKWSKSPISWCAIP